MTETTWRRNVVPKMAIGMAARNVGSGSQTSNAGRGNDERRRLEAPHGIARRGRVPRRGFARRRRNRRCPRASGTRSTRRRSPDDERHDAKIRAPSARPRDASRVDLTRLGRRRADRVDGEGGAAAEVRVPAVVGRTEDGAADPGRVGRRRGPAARRDDVAALEDEPADVVRLRDVADRVDRIVGETTPPWPVQYLMPPASMDMTRSSAAAPAASSAAATACAARGGPRPRDDEARRRRSRDGEPDDAPVKTRVALARVPRGAGARRPRRPRAPTPSRART